jgi:hypothetical protein
VLHGAETADVAALSVRHAGATVAGFLRHGAGPGGRRATDWPAARVPIRCERPLGWIAPNVVAGGAGAPPRGRFMLRASELLGRATIDIAQDRRVLWSGRVARLMPGRSTSLPSDWTEAVDPAGGAVEVRRVAG